MGHFQVAFCPCFRMSPSANLSHENEFKLHLKGLVSKTHFNMKGFPLGLVLKQRQRELGDGLLVDRLSLVQR